MRPGFAAIFAAALLLAGCGDGYRVVQKATPTSTPAGSASTETPAAAAGTAIASTSVAVPATTATDGSSPAPVVPADTSTPVPPTPTATAGPPGQTGIAGTVTIGPTCPVERIDSPCPDRPYAAAITVWQGARKVAETRSDAGGHFVLELEPGTYRVVGESGGAFPRGTEVTVSVERGRLTPVALQYDSGIR